MDSRFAPDARSHAAPPLRSLVALALALAACGDATSGSDSADTSSGDASGTHGPTDASSSTTHTSTTAGPASTDVSASSTTSTSGTGGTSTDTDTDTGGEQLCTFGTTGDSTGSDEPWLEVVNEGEPMVDGQKLRLVCGFQGLFMFEVWPYVGGYEPEDEYSHLDVTLEIDGYPEHPEGHVWHRTNYQTFIGCEDPEYGYEGGYTYSIQLIPDDEILDKTVLHGVPATLTVVMNTPQEQSVEVSATLEIEAVEDEMWMFCEGY